MDEDLAGAREIPELADAGGRHEAGVDEPVLEQRGDPAAVLFFAVLFLMSVHRPGTWALCRGTHHVSDAGRARALARERLCRRLPHGGARSCKSLQHFQNVSKLTVSRYPANFGELATDVCRDGSRAPTSRLHGAGCRRPIDSMDVVSRLHTAARQY